MAYKHKNSRGIEYYLNRKDVVLRGGKKERIYYFSRDQHPEGCDLPDGCTVNENPRNGFLTIKKSSQGYDGTVLERKRVKTVNDSRRITLKKREIQAIIAGLEELKDQPRVKYPVIDAGRRFYDDIIAKLGGEEAS